MWCTSARTTKYTASTRVGVKQIFRFVEFMPLYLNAEVAVTFYRRSYLLIVHPRNAGRASFLLTRYGTYVIDQMLSSSIIRAPTNDNFERYAQYSWLDTWYYLEMRQCS
jgi:hypothetical protein